jgi:pimeloyl-ACP methyl ester carboxylesterase
MPVRGLYELTVLVDALKASLPRVACPVMLLQGSDDPVVVPTSAEGILKHLGDVPVLLKMIESDRHGIINEDIGGTRAAIIASLQAWTNPAPSASPAVL